MATYEPLDHQEMLRLTQELEYKEKMLAEKEANIELREKLLETETAGFTTRSVADVTIEQSTVADQIKSLTRAQQMMADSLKIQLTDLRNKVDSLDVEHRPPSRVSIVDAQNDAWGESTRVDRQNVTPSIKYRDALESVPIFNGSNIPVLRFIRACQRVKSMFGVNHENNITQLLRNKLKGLALTALEDDSFTSIQSLTDKLKTFFGSSKTAYQYRGELGSIIKQNSENIIEYTSRVKDLHFAIIEADTVVFGVPPEGFAIINYETDTSDCFINGLPPDFRIRLKQEAYRDLDSVFACAIKVEREMLRDRASFKQNAESGRTAKTNHIQPNDSCIHCNRRGHEANNCWTKFPDKRPPRNNNNTNSGNYQRSNNLIYQNRPNTGNYHNNYPNQQYSGNNRGNNPNYNKEPNNKITCSYCNKLGHAEGTCYKKQNDERRSKNEQTRPTDQGTRDETRVRPVQLIGASVPSTSD